MKKTILPNEIFLLFGCVVFYSTFFAKSVSSVFHASKKFGLFFVVKKIEN